MEFPGQSNSVYQDLPSGVEVVRLSCNALC